MNTLQSRDQALLRAVWENGVRQSALPPSFEAVRQKYKMTDQMYDSYWRMAAASQLTGDDRVKQAFEKARRKLRTIEKKTGARTMPPKTEDASSHSELMREALRIANATCADNGSAQVSNHPEGEEEASLRDIDRESSSVKAEPEWLVRHREAVRSIADIRANRPGTVLVKEVEDEIQSIRGQTKLQRKVGAASTSEDHEKADKTEPNRQTNIAEGRSTEEALWPRRTPIVELQHERSVGSQVEQQIELGGLKEQLQQSTKEEETRSPPNRRSRRAQIRKEKEESFDLGDILDVAVKKSRLMFGAEKRPTDQALGQSPGLSSSSTADQGNLQPGRHGKNQDLHSGSPSNRSNPPRRASDSLRLSVPSTGELYIESDLVFDLNAEIPELQSQIFRLQERLESSYPRIGALPYNIWESNNPKTLQTWLKILVKRWQTRFDDVNEQQDAGYIDQQTKAVLDQMVRDHDLSNEGAKRMAAKLKEIPERREDMTVDAEGTIDWDEFDAGGLGFLKNDDAGAEEVEDTWHSSLRPESKTLPLMQPDKRPTASSEYDSITKRLYSTSSRKPLDPPQTSHPEKATPQSLPHLTSTGSAHMVSVSSKPHTTRTAIAIGTVYFSNATPLTLVKSNSLKKGDVLSVSRIAGIMAAKKCPDLIPLCHPIPLTHVGVDLKAFESSPDSQDHNDMGHGGIMIEAKVSCTGPTGVEMEALTSVMGTALSVVDMCKAVDKFQRIQDVRVVLKEGGKSGVWREEGWRTWQE